MNYFAKVLFLICLVLPAMTWGQSPLKGTKVTIDKVVMNRKATKLSESEQATYIGAYTGFKWQKDDNETINWYPQGITEITWQTFFVIL